MRKYHYITIEREYGSGGTKIARKLASITGVPCYGHEILEAVSKKYNFSIENIERYEENVPNSLLYTVYALSQATSANPDMVSKEGHIFLAEQDEIRKMSGEGPAIFLGHCASEALKERRGVVKVFIWATEKDKRNRIIEDYAIPEHEVESIMKRFNRRRERYYYANTTKRWNDFTNYDIVLNSSELGIDGCVAVLGSLLADIPE